jgi:catechol 2,3-dioxygenase-like lactoylglutathione lyase family enzyme
MRVGTAGVFKRVAPAAERTHAVLPRHPIPGHHRIGSRREVPMRLGYAMIFVHDMPRSVALYRDVLGLRLRMESPEWTEFATTGATLALHGTNDAAGAPVLPHAEAPGICRPGLAVADLDSVHARMVAHGAPCVQPPTDLHGVRFAQYVDPDWLTFSVSEDRPAGG